MELESPTKILYRMVDPNYTKCRSFIMEISCEQLAMFNTVPPPSYPYRLHDHGYEEPEFDELKNVYELESTDLPVMTLMVKSNSFVYGHLFKGIIMRLNLNNLGCPWERIIQPFCPHRWDPKLISLRDKLYVFGGIPTTLLIKIDFDLEPFGEVYDPEYDQWSILVAPPQAPLLNRGFDSLFVASLGESEGKILVYSPSIVEDSVIYIYDVDTQVWETHPGSVLDSVLVSKKEISGSEVINEDDGMLYWLDKRTAFICAFDWKKQQLYSGPIVGLECEHGFNSMIRETNFVSLHHLSRDLFCLYWHTSNWVGVKESDVKTEHHFTVLKVVKYTSNWVEEEESALDAFVIGCRQVTVSGSYCSFDALHI